MTAPWVVKVDGRFWARADSLREVTEIVNHLIAIRDRPRVSVSRGLEEPKVA